MDTIFTHFGIIIRVNIGRITKPYFVYIKKKQALKKLHHNTIGKLTDMSQELPSLDLLFISSLIFSSYTISPLITPVLTDLPKEVKKIMHLTEPLHKKDVTCPFNGATVRLTEIRIGIKRSCVFDRQFLDFL